MTHRFINADGLVSTGTGILGHNMFAYCGDNPVNRIDPTGEFWWIIPGYYLKRRILKIVYFYNECKRVNNELESLPEPSVDITESFRKTLKANARTVKDTTNSLGIIESGKQFYNKVRNQGEWDLKQFSEYQGTFRFNGFVVQGQDLGNINFGYTGKALGLPDSVLLRGAGLAQILAGTSKRPFIFASYGDDLRDQIYIRYGIKIYNEDN